MPPKARKAAAAATPAGAGKGPESKRGKKAAVREPEGEEEQEFPDEDEDLLLEEEGAPTAEDADEIDVDFEFFDPREGDFHGLKALLNGYLDDRAFNSSGLVDAIIAQASAGDKNIGTVVKNSADEAPIGILTVLNLAKLLKTPPGQDIARFLRAKLAATPGAAPLAQLLSSPAGTGLLISERVLNCPPQLAPPLWASLWDELEAKVANEPRAANRDEFRFTQYLLLSRLWTDRGPDPVPGMGGMGGMGGKGGAAAGTTPKPTAGKKRKGGSGGGGGGGAGSDGVLVYVRPEDEVLSRLCDWSATFGTPNDQLGEGADMTPGRLVLLFAAKHVAATRRAVEASIATF